MLPALAFFAPKQNPAYVSGNQTLLGLPEVLEHLKEHDSDSGLSLSGDWAGEDEDDGHTVPHALTTRHGTQIRAVIRLDLKDNTQRAF